MARDKRELILGLCRGKRVLDLGCINHSWRMSLEQDHWLHRDIRAVASSCTGVDYLADDAAELNRRGFDVIAADVLADPPPGRYEVVVAGDLIEHLESPSVFLDYVAAALEDDGVAVITTPNAYYIAQTFTILARGRPDMNPEHVLLFDPLTFANLVDRSPLRIRELYWLTPSWPFLWNSHRLIYELLGRPVHLLTKLLVRARPFLNSDLAAVLEKRPGGKTERDPAASGAKVAEFLTRPVS